MKKDELINELKLKYVGREFNKGFGAWSEIGKEIIDQLKEEFKDHVDKNVEEDYKDWAFTFSASSYGNQTMVISYRNYGIFYIEFKKRKGESYRSWDGWKYKYYIKDIIIEDCHNFLSADKYTLEKQLNAIDECKDAKKKKRDLEKERAIEAFKLLKEHFGLSNNEIRDIASMIDNNYYSLKLDEIGEDNAES